MTGFCIGSLAPLTTSRVTDGCRGGAGIARCTSRATPVRYRFWPTGSRAPGAAPAASWTGAAKQARRRLAGAGPALWCWGSRRSPAPPVLRRVGG